MNRGNDHQQQREAQNNGGSVSPIRHVVHQKANPLSVVAICVYIPAFLSLVIFAQQRPENWFVRNFLGGTGIAIAALLLLGAMMVVVAVIERRMKKRKPDGESKSV